MSRPARSRAPGWLGTLFVAAAVACTSTANAATRLHALVVGNNAAFPVAGEESLPALAPLEYADDDAAAISELIGGVAASLHLLTVMDAATQTLYPKLVAAARPPSLAAVEQAVSAIAAEIERDRARGDQSVVWLFFSGHGSASYRGEPALALSDGAMRREYLYQRVLARLPAAYVHLLVDACHAESIVRPRDSNAEVVSVAPEVANALLVRSTLAGFPNVGAILVSSRDAQAHEWDAIGHGVFTHELLSALRGAADVNGDRLIEYSEISAFMSAANRGIGDARARVAISLRAPALNRRAPLLDLSAYPPATVSWLVGVSGRRGVIQILDALGRRLLTLHNALDLSTSLLLPPSSTLYVVARGEEAQFSARPGQITRFADLEFVRSPSRSRGLSGANLERGLFVIPFGRGYYEGFIDNAPELVSVPLARDTERDELAAPTPLSARPTPDPSLRLSLGLGLSNSTADVLGPSYGLRLALAPAAVHGPWLGLEAGQSGEGRLSEWRVLGKLGWLWQTAPSRLRVYAGPRVGAGIIIQRVEGQPTLSSAVGVFGGAVGLTGRVSRQLGIFAEFELAAQLLQLDGATRLLSAPSGWMGASWEM
ncbi:MAG TPA: caspase family protein [Polyangiaceae bacterium]|nr:caspase family protein [Polyangiaceae bacterium]